MFEEQQRQQFSALSRRVNLSPLMKKKLSESQLFRYWNSNDSICQPYASLLNDMFLYVDERRKENMKATSWGAVYSNYCKFQTKKNHKPQLYEWNPRFNWIFSIIVEFSKTRHSPYTYSCMTKPNKWIEIKIICTLYPGCRYAFTVEENREVSHLVWYRKFCTPMLQSCSTPAFCIKLSIHWTRSIPDTKMCILRFLQLVLLSY